MVLGRHILDADETTPSTHLVRQGLSDFSRRMAAYAPSAAARLHPTSIGIPPDLDISLSYANIAILLSPKVVPLALPSEVNFTRANRVKAIESAWTQMRHDTQPSLKGDDYKGKGKAVQNASLLRGVADWMVDVLVSLFSKALLISLVPINRCPGPSFIAGDVSRGLANCLVLDGSTKSTV